MKKYFLLLLALFYALELSAKPIYIPEMVVSSGGFSSILKSSPEKIKKFVERNTDKEGLFSLNKLKEVERAATPEGKNITEGKELWLSAGCKIEYCIWVKMLKPNGEIWVEKSYRNSNKKLYYRE